MSKNTIPYLWLPNLETKRLLLRKLRYEDVDDIYEYAQDPEVAKFVMWNPHSSKEETFNFMNTVIEYYIKHRPAPWGIELKSEKKIIGTVGFTKLFPKENKGEIGYTLSRLYWNRGIMTEAVKKVLEYGFEKMELDEIEANTIVANEQSARVLKKAGMKLVKTINGHIVVKGDLVNINLFSISKPEFFNLYK